MVATRRVRRNLQRVRILVSRRADRRDAPHPGRRKTVDLREPVSACAELLHAAAGPGGAAARDLYRLADAPHAGRPSGGRIVHPAGRIAIMALSWIYALYGNVGLVAGLFFGLKAAVLAIVLEAVVRISRRALKKQPAGRHSGLAFMVIFVLRSAVSAHHSGAGLFGFFRSRRAGWQRLPLGGRNVRRECSAMEAVSGRCDDRASSTTETLRVAGIWLLLWLRPGRGAARFLGAATCSARSPCSFPRWPW